MHTARHHEVAGTLGRALDEHRGLNLQEVEVAQIVAHKHSHAVTQLKVLAHGVATNVEVTVFHAQVVAAVADVFNREGPFGYLLISSVKAFYRAFTSNRYSDHSLYIAMGIFPITPMVCGVLQAFFLIIPIMCYGATAAVLLLYITATENRISKDPLTKINNRQEMNRYLSQKMKSRTQKMDLYLLIMDVDHFKGINDKYGHVEGDRALVTVARALEISCSDAKNRAFLSRYGGDEFIVVMEAENEQQVEETAAIIRDNIIRLNEESGAAFKLEACIGYARYDFDNPVTIPQLIARADEKLYEMKKNR